MTSALLSVCRCEGTFLDAHLLIKFINNMGQCLVKSYNSHSTNALCRKMDLSHEQYVTPSGWS